MSNSLLYPSSIKAVAIRLTRLDECGVVPATTVASSRLTTASFAMAELSPEYDDGSEIKIKNGNGDIEAYRKGEPRLLGFTGKLMVNGVPIQILEMTLGATILSDSIGPAVRGGAMPSKATSPGVAMLELWSRAGVDGNCGAAMPYYKWIMPLCSQWKLADDFTFSEEDPLEIGLEFFAQANAEFAPSITAEQPAGITSASLQESPLAWYTVDALPTIEANSTYDTATV